MIDIATCERPGKLKILLIYILIFNNATGKRHLGRPRRRWEDNIRMGLKKLGINMRNWGDSAQYRDYWSSIVNAALNLWIY